MIVPALALLAVMPRAQAPSAVVTPASADKKICRRLEPATGSNMPGKRVCHSRDEWAAIGAADQRGVDAFRSRAHNGLRGTLGE